jgi:hypothetical protein
MRSYGKRWSGWARTGRESHPGRNLGEKVVSCGWEPLCVGALCYIWYDLARDIQDVDLRQSFS